MKKIITLTTDLGDQFAVAQLHAVLASLGFDGKIVENHGVSPFSITEGAFQISVLAKYSPPETIHVGVIDPGVGSNRRSLVIRTDKSWFIGPDNGLLYPAAKNENIRSLWKLKELHINPQTSRTFHGRDIFIRAAVYISQSKDPTDFGSQPINPEMLVKLSFNPGQVVHVDHYGNLKIYWPDRLNGHQKLTILTNRVKFDVPVVNTFSDVPPNMPLALLGSSGTLELAVNLARADTFFDCQVGEVIKIEYA